ncbi:MAG: hypothetical protein FRX49_01041 [Trebouxia sp. A1-2]|nr:MAG: hypothetical protein FRX49_01041 [Trebouxia sp. A1-2]
MLLMIIMPKDAVNSQEQHWKELKLQWQVPGQVQGRWAMVSGPHGCAWGSSTSCGGHRRCEEQAEAGWAKQHSAHSVQPQACLGAGAAHVGAADQTALRLSSQERVRCPGWVSFFPEAGVAARRSTQYPTGQKFFTS